VFSLTLSTAVYERIDLGDVERGRRARGNRSWGDWCQSIKTPTQDSHIPNYHENKNPHGLSVLMLLQGALNSRWEKVLAWLSCLIQLRNVYMVWGMLLGWVGV
jgi:hypothetical protein